MASPSDDQMTAISVQLATIAAGQIALTDGFKEVREGQKEMRKDITAIKETLAENHGRVTGLEYRVGALESEHVFLTGNLEKKAPMWTIRSLFGAMIAIFIAAVAALFTGSE